MKKCKAEGCDKFCRFENGTIEYCVMHLARLKRHGTLGLKKELGTHGLEKMPHDKVDDLIRQNKSKKDSEITSILHENGYLQATEWNVKYRRRKLNIIKYTGKSHNAFDKKEATKIYGKKCEICNFCITTDVHHIKGKKSPDGRKIENLIILCPNCHALITRKIIHLNSREDISSAKKYLSTYHNNVYTF